MKTNNAKKIASIAIIALVLALTIVTIVLALVPKKLYNPISDGYKLVHVYRDGLSNSYKYGDLGSDESNGIINDLLELHENSLKDNVLSHIFQGTSSFKPTVVNNSYSDVFSMNNADGVLCIVFNYLEEQTLVIDGEEYKDETALSSKTVTYNKIYMPISNSDSYEECIVYLADSSNKSSYQIKFLAHQKEIYQYIINIDLPLVKG